MFVKDTDPEKGFFESHLESHLLKKYDIPAPRYTSYPTVPYWDKNPTTKEWISHLNHSLKNLSPWALYIHIPFCETLCTFCGCNTSITRNHGVEAEYIENLLKEWELYRSVVPSFEKNTLSQFHYGGGTPTFLSPDNLKRLTLGIFEKAQICENEFEGSIEVDPRRTSYAHLKTLYDLGFRRISLGVQDFNEEVQRLVNRVQDFSITKRLTEDARALGFKSVNFDLIYGLPRQSVSYMENTIEKTIQLRPDRIALYSLAFVPWIKPQQRRFKISDLPVGYQKRKLYELSRRRLESVGYIEIGMDHFSLPEDDLSKAMQKGNLHRNFMGYVSSRTEVLLGLGVSAISESPFCFHQNQKVLPFYKKKIQSNSLPSLRGHVLSEEDYAQRKKILKLITQLELELDDESELLHIRRSLQTIIEDNLIEIKGLKLTVLKKGRTFLRNICMAFDKRLFRKKPETKVFSQSI